MAVNRVALDACRLSDRDSIVVYANHASWWDPLVAMYMAVQFFPDFRMYAPIDAEAFAKYRMFGKMGFFPVDQNSLKGAGEFLRRSRQILSVPGTSLWITPEGRFCDVRDDSANLMPGLSHLAANLQNQQASSLSTQHVVWFVPVAVEYTFWEERLPEILIWFGSPIPVSGQPKEAALTEGRHTKAEWDQILSLRLREVQSALAAAAIARNSDAFEVLLANRSGTFIVYDWWRSLKSRISGKSFVPDHSDKLR